MTDENRQQLGKVYDDFMSYVEDNRAKPFLLTKVEDGAVFDFTFLPVTQYEGLMNAHAGGQLQCTACSLL